MTQASQRELASLHSISSAALVSPQPLQRTRRALFVLYFIWAALIGVSVPIEMVNTTFINKDSDKPDYHAFYVSNLAVFMGGIELIPLSVRGVRPWRRPRKWWSTLGGLCALPAFITITAGSQLGVQTVLVTQLAALLGTFLLLDVIDGLVRISDYGKILGFLLVLAGVCLENLVGGGGKSVADAKAVLLVILVAVSGIGYALQAKCNGRLAEDVGSPARATMVSALVNVVAALPIDAWLLFGEGVVPKFDPAYWYLWILAGFQSAFYIGSMAFLPSRLGFTTCYMTTLAAKLTTSLLVDSEGWTGTRIPVSFTRVFALLCVLVGGVIFNTCTSARRANQQTFTLSSPGLDAEAGEKMDAALNAPVNSSANGA